MVISFDFQRMTYAQDLTFGLRLAFGLGLEVLVALASALLGYLAFLIASLPCLSALPCCLALACRRYFARLSAFAALLAVVPCPALRLALPCLALPYAMDVKPCYTALPLFAVSERIAYAPLFGLRAVSLCFSFCLRAESLLYKIRCPNG